MEWSLFLPLILAGLLYGVISIVAGVTSSRGNDQGAERVRDYGFLLLLVMAAWTVVLTLIALVSEPDEVWDMVVITLVIVVFFVILLLIFFGISVLLGGLRSATSRRRRVTTDEL
jgi:uncharacterized membrane protein